MIDCTKHGLEREQKKGYPKIFVNWLIDYEFYSNKVSLWPI